MFWLEDFAHGGNLLRASGSWLPPKHGSAAKRFQTAAPTSVSPGVGSPTSRKMTTALVLDLTTPRPTEAEQVGG